MKGRKFVFGCVDGFHYKCNKKSLHHGRPYIESPEWLKKSTKKNKENIIMFFKYAVPVSLNHEKIEKHLKRISKLNLIGDI